MGHDHFYSSSIFNLISVLETTKITTNYNWDLNSLKDLQSFEFSLSIKVTDLFC